MIQLLAKAHSGGAYRLLFFTGVDAEKSVFQTHAHLWADGKQKGLHIAQATDADLATRMMEAGGHLFWASPECWLMLDTAHAKKGAEASRGKINFHYLLECQKFKTQHRENTTTHVQCVTRSSCRLAMHKQHFAALEDTVSPKEIPIDTQWPPQTAVKTSTAPPCKKSMPRICFGRIKFSGP